MLISVSVRTEGDRTIARFLFDSFVQAIDFADNWELGDIRFNNDGAGNLRISIFEDGVFQTTFGVDNFEDGKTIYALRPSGDFDIDIGDGDGAIDDVGGTYPGYDIGVDAGFLTFSGNFEVVYHFETVIIGSTVYDMQSGVPIWGGDGDDTLIGFDVNDDTGQAYSDTLRGFGGADSLIGQAGDDLLEGGLGDDYMLGGQGDDVYRVVAGDGVD
ncbi:MAG: hypothetical protein MRY64_00415, partial [Hyphomonadaceae bacterium]|nr:hypothetical protein [Hyphomonadaceae bacterium]